MHDKLASKIKICERSSVRTCHREPRKLVHHHVRESHRQAETNLECNKSDYYKRIANVVLAKLVHANETWSTIKLRVHGRKQKTISIDGRSMLKLFGMSVDTVAKHLRQPFLDILHVWCE